MPNNNPQQTTPQQQISRAAEGANRAAERLESSAENAASVAIEKVRQVREDAQSGIEQQREQIVNRIRRVGGVLRSGSQTLATDDALSQQLFDSAGDQVERVAEYVANLTPGQLADDVTSLARRRPGLFFGGSFILGLALGRFAKSSSSVGGASYGSDGLDDYEDTLSVRPAEAPRARKQQRRGAASTKTAQTTVDAPYTSSAARASSAPNTAPAGSTEKATIGSGTAQSPAANAAPSYGATSPAKAPLAVPAADEQPAASKAHSVDPGQGAKS